MRQGADSDVGFHTELKNSVYESSRRAPLGKARDRGSSLPAKVALDNNIRFGKPNQAVNGQVKTWPRTAWDQSGRDVILPMNGITTGAEDEMVAHALYVRSHQAYDPGEQVKRGYAWPAGIAFDVGGHRFGGTSSKAQGLRGEITDGGVKSALFGGAWSKQDDGLHSKICHASEERRRLSGLGEPPLGVRPTSRQGEPQISFGHAYGAPSRRQSNDDNVGALIRCCSTPEMLQPDRDLGRCVREGRRNITTSDRPFGKPSTIPWQPDEVSSTASTSASSRASSPRCKRWLSQRKHGFPQDSIVNIVQPDTVGSKCMDRNEFEQACGKEEIRSLLSAAGYEIRGGDFDEVWKSAAQTYLTSDPKSRGGANETSVEIPLRIVVDKLVEMQLRSGLKN